MRRIEAGVMKVSSSGSSCGSRLKVRRKETGHAQRWEEVGWIEGLPFEVHERVNTKTTSMNSLMMMSLDRRHRRMRARMTVHQL